MTDFSYLGHERRNFCKVNLGSQEFLVAAERRSLRDIRVAMLGRSSACSE